MNLTPIEWTTFSANPLKYRDADGRVVWACVHASQGCMNCYSEALAKRWGKGGPFNVPTTSKLTPFLDHKELRHMLTAKTIKGVPVSGSMCFVEDMSDLFGEWVPDELIARLFAVFALRPDVIWQILTKRAERMRRVLNDPAFRDEVEVWITMMLEDEDVRLRFGGDAHNRRTDDARAAAPDVNGDDWPLSNVWCGTSVEDQQRADECIPHLLQTPAAVRFVSAEPLLSGLDIAKHRPGALGLHWLILGAESGHGARSPELWWFKNLINQCRDADVAPFVKQIGRNPSPRRIPYSAAGPGAYVLEHLNIRDAKGGDPSEWPEDLRVREFPQVREAATR